MDSATALLTLFTICLAIGSCFAPRNLKSIKSDPGASSSRAASSTMSIGEEELRNAEERVQNLISRIMTNNDPSEFKMFLIEAERLIREIHQKYQRLVPSFTRNTRQQIAGSISAVLIILDITIHSRVLRYNDSSIGNHFDRLESHVNELLEMIFRDLDMETVNQRRSSREAIRSRVIQRRSIPHSTSNEILPFEESPVVLNPGENIPLQIAIPMDRNSSQKQKTTKKSKKN